MPPAKTSSVDQAANVIAQDCLAARTRLLSRTITGIYDRALRPHGLTIGQLNLLVVVSAHGPLSAADVAGLLNMEKSTVSRNVRLMRERGWIEAGTTDAGRGRQLTLTNEGQRLVEQAFPAWKEAQVRTKAALGRESAASIQSIGNAMWNFGGSE